MKIRNLTNAFVSIVEGDTKIVCDPWITNGIYDGSWHIEPPLQTHEQTLVEATLVLITHIHADHFDVAALELTTCPIFIPDVYPNRNVVARKLSETTQKRVAFISTSVPSTLSQVTIEFIPPMNRYGHQIDHYTEEDVELTAIDTGILVSNGSKKVCLLADNFPYHPTSAGASLERMKNCSVLMFPYNACADDYPVCYDNFSLEEKQARALKRNDARARFLVDAFTILQPRTIVPYSSDFLIAGARAEEFVKVHPQQFIDKTLVADLMERLSGIRCFSLREHDELHLLDDGKLMLSSFPTEVIDHVAAARALATKKLVSYPPVSDEQLFILFKEAAGHMLSRMKVESVWRIELCNTDTNFVMGLDLKQGTVYQGATGQENTLQCLAPSGHLNALLTFKMHWDNAMIAYSLSWKRIPDQYDLGLYKALNYLHVPLKKAA